MFQLTFPQKRILANQQIYGDSKFAHMYGEVFIENQTIEALSDAINAAISYFDCLRIRFVQSGSQILQSIEPFRYGPVETKPAGFGFLSEKIDLFSEKPNRLYIVCDAGKALGYFFIFHHAVVDAYTITLIIKFIDDYLKEGVPEAPPSSFQRFAEAERAYLGSADLNADLEFFTGRLSRSLNGKYVPDFDLSCKRAGKTLTAEQSSRLLSYCKQQDISLFKLIYAALFLLLYLEDGKTTQTISTTHHGRTSEELLRTGGMSAGTIPVVADIDFSLTFEEFLAGVSANISECLERPRFPIELALKKIKQKSLFDLNIAEVMLTSIPFGDGSKIFRYSPGEDISDLNFKLNPNQKPKGADIEIAVDYRLGKYTEKQTRKLLDRLVDIAFMFVKHGDSAISDALAPPHDVIRQIMDTIENNPDTLAVSDGKNTFSYRKLGERVDAVAAALSESPDGPPPGDAGHVIGVVNERSVWYVVAVLGILKAGKAFTPLDPSLPKQRLDSILRQARITQVFSFSDTAPPLNGVETIDVRGLRTAEGRIEARVSRLAYILFTSGSSGAPKGVMVGRQGLFSLLEALALRYGLKEDEKFSAYCDFNFDVSVAEVLLPLFSAGSLYIANEEQRLDFGQLDEFMRANSIDHAFFPTKAGETFIKNFPDCPISNLTLIGEKMTYCRRTSYNVFNAYGPAEFTIFSHIENIEKEGGRYSIGQPIKNVIDIIIGNSGEAAPVGELILIGEQAALGYLNDYSLTAERFFKVPNADGCGYRRAYKTSDKVERGPDGKIYFLSRLDRQIKYRGYRIELEEIENAAVDSSLVKAAACSFDGNELFLSLIPKEDFKRDRLMRFLSDRIPSYALPHHILCVDDLPRTKTGKIDYQANAKAASAKAAAKRSPASGPAQGEALSVPTRTEKKLLRIISAFAPRKYKPVKTSDNIFEIGIDSLDILQIMLDIERKLNTQIRFSDFVLHPVIRELAQVAGEKARPENVTLLREGAGKPLVLVFDMSRDIASYYPLLEALDPGYPIYGVSSTFIPPGAALQDYAKSLADELLEKGRFEQCDLAGYSVGGVVALEMAEQLGEKAGNVFLVDTPNYRIHPKRLNYGFVLDNIFSIAPAYGVRGLFAYTRKCFGDMADGRALAEEGKKLIRMINRYEPQIPAHSVILFASSEMKGRTDKWLGWKSFIPDNMIGLFEGKHVSFIKKEAAAIARTIALWRVRADSETTA